MVKEDTLELNQSPTTIWIKKGTKKMLDELGGRKDTYDDIIRALINKNQSLEKQTDLTPVAENRVMISTENIRKSKLIINDKEYIEFSYNTPTLPLDELFRLKIIYLKVVYNSKEVKIHENYKKRIEMAKDYLNIVEKIIRQHIDPLFRIDVKHILDLGWWRRKYKNLGLSDKAYKEDIEMELIKLGIVP